MDSTWVLTKSLSCIWLFATLWAGALQSLSMGFSRKNTGMGCHALLMGIFLTQGSNPIFYASCIGRQILYRWATREANKDGIQFSSVAQSCPTLCDPMNCSTPGLPVHHQFPEFTQTHVHWVGDAIQPSHPLLSPSPPVLNLSQHKGLYKWVSFSHQGAKELAFQLQHQSFQWIPRTDLL